MTATFLQREQPQQCELFAGFEWIAKFAEGWQWGEQGILAELVRRIGGVNCAVEIGAGDGEELPLTLERLVGKYPVMCYEQDDEARDKLKAKFGDDVACLPAFQDGENLKLTQPELVLIDVDGIDVLFMQIVLASCKPRLLMVEHYDKAGPYVNDMPQAQFQPPSWLLGMRTFNGFVIQAPSQCLDRLAAVHGMQPIYRTRCNSIYATNATAEDLRNV